MYRLLRRNLGSWTSRFEAARSSTQAVRLALGKELAATGAWKLEQDDAESRAMESEASAAAGSQFTFVLQVENTAVAIMRAALMPTGQDTNKYYGLLIGTQCDPALALASVGEPLIQAATRQLAAHGAERVLAVAPLPGLCAWVVEQQAWNKLDSTTPGFSDDQPGAVEAVARGVPRPGHSVLGIGTFKAARPAFERFALEYAKATLSDADSEAAMFASSGAEVVGVNCAIRRDCVLTDCLWTASVVRSSTLKWLRITPSAGTIDAPEHSFTFSANSCAQDNHAISSSALPSLTALLSNPGRDA